MKHFLTSGAMAAFFIFPEKNIFACSVCFGDANSLQSKALGGAVLFLLFVVGGILAAIATLAFKWSHRARKLAEAGKTAVC